MVVHTPDTAPCFISSPQGEIRVSGGGTQVSLGLNLLGKVQCAAGLLSTQEADDLLVGISTILPKENGVSGYETCPRPHSLEESEVSYHSRLTGSPNALFHFHLGQLL